jgi:hypothetical protein
MKYDKLSQSAENRARISESHRLPHRIDLAQTKLKPLDWAAELKIRREDIVVFEAAARSFDHIISVRATNARTLCYIGQKSFTPKPIDCKPKTADAGAFVRAVGTQVDCAGLVVDPTIVGSSAFKSDKKKVDARSAWESFLKDKSEDEIARKVFRRRESKGFYAVDTYKQSKYFGCLMLANQDVPAREFNLNVAGWQEFKRTCMCYIHGDYDLYGLIDVEKTEATLHASRGRDRHSPGVIKERLHGMPHFYTERFPEIKAFLNAGIGAEMIQHAAQDLRYHHKDELYVFYPTGGKYHLVETADAIREIYELVFKQEVTR